MFRAVKINGYLKAMSRLDISKERLLAGTTIDPDLVADPEYLISLEQYHAVVINMMKLSRNPGIAFTLADLANLNEFGIVGYAVISSNSLRQGLDVWTKYSNSLIGTPLNIDSIRDAAPGFELIISTPTRATSLHRFVTEENLVQGKKLVRDLTGIEPIISRLSLSYPEPGHHALYDEFCKCPIEFNAPQTIIRYQCPELDTPTQTRNEDLFKMCAQHCLEVMRSLPESGPLRSRIRDLFLASPGRLPDLKAASATLGMSVSTLRRHLEADNQSYQAIKDEFRFDLAREYLCSGHMAPKQVAYLLGFTSTSDFCRAFKTWTGQTVRQFMKGRIDGAES